MAKCVECKTYDRDTKDFHFCRGVNPMDAQHDCPCFRQGRPRNTKPYVAPAPKVTA